MSKNDQDSVDGTPRSGVLKVRVTPRSSRNRVEVQGDSVRVWVCASPNDGEANKAVIQILAKGLGIAPCSLEILRGASSRDKEIHVPLETGEVLKRLQAYTS
jgi:uncharacterized protein YggU (UPF0235/DUF167 family)